MSTKGPLLVITAHPGIEHPTGFFDTSIEVSKNGTALRVHHSGVVRTARKLFDGRVWSRPTLDP